MLLTMKTSHCKCQPILSPPSYLLFQKALTTPSTNPPYPSLMLPNAPLLHTRLINAAIQAFAQLFVYTGSGSRGRMTEVVIGGMASGSSMTAEAKQVCAHNILCILWCVVDVIMWRVCVVDSSQIRSLPRATSVAGCCSLDPAVSNEQCGCSQSSYGCGGSFSAVCGD